MSGLGPMRVVSCAAMVDAMTMKNAIGSDPTPDITGLRPITICR